MTVEVDTTNTGNPSRKIKAKFGQDTLSNGKKNITKD